MSKRRAWGSSILAVQAVLLKHVVQANAFVAHVVVAVMSVLGALACTLGLVACSGHVSAEPDRAGAESPADASRSSDSPRYPVEIHMPDVLRGIRTGTVDSLQRPLLAPCGSCHASGAYALRERNDPPVQGPHAGLSFRHGELRCGACHDARRAEALHLADGRTLPLVEAMTLCGQCHGTQMRDYRHGSHGGMSGYWDLSRGPRVRNHCIDCHDPHAPAYPRYQPAPPPPDPRRRPRG
ncbi:MAG: hypothetical protein OXU20_41990 [Myxococcales bacterium]|nr:hypothetical protein [Myxococcales bacterium]